MALLWSINQSTLIYKAQTHNTKASRNTLAQRKRKPADPSRATWSHSGKEQQKKFFVGRNLEQIPSLHSLHENFSSKRVVKGYMETHKVTWFTAPPASTEQCTKLPSKGINVNISWSLKRKRKAIIDQTILQSKKEFTAHSNTLKNSNNCEIMYNVFVVYYMRFTLNMHIFSWPKIYSWV